MKSHTKSGADILDGKGELLKMAREISLSHHEKWDGSGYPYGTSGDEIPLSGRICAIADVFDALTMERPYKKAWAEEDAKQHIIKLSGIQFDPQLVVAFSEAFPEILRFKSLYSDSTIDPKAILTHASNTNIEDKLVSWSEQYSVGIDIIDTHHQYLFDCINSLFNSIKKNESAGQISKTLKKLEEYTFIHFSEEEKMMREMDYPNLEDHIKSHHSFENKIEEFQQELRHNPLISLSPVVEFLKDWLVNHICKIDSQIINDCNSA